MTKKQEKRDDYVLNKFIEHAAKAQEKEEQEADAIKPVLSTELNVDTSKAVKSLRKLKHEVKGLDRLSRRNFIKFNVNNKHEVKKNNDDEQDLLQSLYTLDLFLQYAHDASEKLSKRADDLRLTKDEHELLHTILNSVNNSYAVVTARKNIKTLCAKLSEE